MRFEQHHIKKSSAADGHQNENNLSRRNLHFGVQIITNTMAPRMPASKVPTSTWH
jgi:hypothetical protein